jgi:hypothetical protein
MMVPVTPHRPTASSIPALPSCPRRRRIHRQATCSPINGINLSLTRTLRSRSRPGPMLPHPKRTDCTTSGARRSVQRALTRDDSLVIPSSPCTGRTLKYRTFRTPVRHSYAHTPVPSTLGLSALDHRRSASPSDALLSTAIVPDISTPTHASHDSPPPPLARFPPLFPSTQVASATMSELSVPLASSDTAEHVHLHAPTYQTLTSSLPRSSSPQTTRSAHLSPDAYFHPGRFSAFNNTSTALVPSPSQFAPLPSLHQYITHLTSPYHDITPFPPVASPIIPSYFATVTAPNSQTSEAENYVFASAWHQRL